MSDGSSNDDDYVGYGHPPRHSRFKPGQSGNPSGRPKGSRPTPQILLEELARVVKVTENGQPVRLTAHQALLRRAIHAAMAGDISAARLILAHTQMAEARPDQDHAVEEPLTAEEIAVLAMFSMVPGEDDDDDA